MAAKRFRLPEPIQDLRRDPRVCSLSYDPSTGAFAVTFHKPQPVQPDFAQETEQEPDPVDFRFALERWNESPKQRGRQ